MYMNSASHTLLQQGSMAWLRISNAHATTCKQWSSRHVALTSCTTARMCHLEI